MNRKLRKPLEAFLFLIFFTFSFESSFALNVVTENEQNPYEFSGSVKTYLITDVSFFSGDTLRMNAACFRPNKKRIGSSECAPPLQAHLSLFNSAGTFVGRMKITSEELKYLRLAGQHNCPYTAYIDRNLADATIKLNCDPLN